MLSRFWLAVLISLVSGSFSSAQAQSQPQSQPPGNQPYTIQTISRVVLTDVTVTDSKGNPVHGLPLSAFRISDNNQPQTIASFEEHSGTPAAMPIEPVATAKGVYSNEYLEHLPPVLSVVIIDIANLSITDQMYLNYELTKFFKDPPSQPLAIYLRAGNGCFLLQNFTTDRAPVVGRGPQGDSAHPADRPGISERHRHDVPDCELSQPTAGTQERAVVFRRIDIISARRC